MAKKEEAPESPVSGEVYPKNTNTMSGTTDTGQLTGTAEMVGNAKALEGATGNTGDIPNKNDFNNETSSGGTNTSPIANTTPDKNGMIEVVTKVRPVQARDEARIEARKAAKKLVAVDKTVQHIRVSPSLYAELQNIAAELPKKLREEFSGMFQTISVVDGLPYQILVQPESVGFINAPGVDPTVQVDQRYWPNRFIKNPLQDASTKNQYGAGDILYECHDDGTFYVLGVHQQTAEFQARNHMPTSNVLEIVQSGKK